MIVEQSASEELDELYRYLVSWANSQEKRLKLREESLDKREKELRALEVKLTGNGT